MYWSQWKYIRNAPLCAFGACLLCATLKAAGRVLGFCADEGTYLSSFSKNNARMLSVKDKLSLKTFFAERLTNRIFQFLR